MWLFQPGKLKNERLTVTVPGSPMMIDALLYAVGSHSPTSMALLFEILKDAMNAEVAGFSRIEDTDIRILRIYASKIEEGTVAEAIREDLRLLRELRLKLSDKGEDFPVFLAADLIQVDPLEIREYDRYPPSNVLVSTLTKKARDVLGQDMFDEKVRGDFRKSYFDQERNALTEARLRWENLSPDEQKEHLIQASDSGQVVIFDLNTTGLDPDTNEIIQFSAVDLDGNVLLDQKFCPSVIRRWNRAAQNANGVTYEMLTAEPSLMDFLPKIQAIFDSARLIGGFYIDRFDLAYLVQAGIRFPEDCAIIDEKREARGLMAYAKKYGYEMQDRQDALDRAKAAAHGIRLHYLFPNKDDGQNEDYDND